MAGVAQPATSDPTFDAPSLHWISVCNISIELRGQPLSSQHPSAFSGYKLVTWKNVASGRRGSGKAPLPLARLSVVAEASVGVTPGQASGSNQSLPSKMVLGKPVNGRQVAKVMKDGTALCAAFQRGACKTKGKCPQGAHRCGAIPKKDRVCGHGAGQCRTTEEAPATSSGTEDTVLGPSEPPLMVDLMAGPNAPLTKAFIFCGWRTITVDWLIDASHDLSHPLRQASLHEQLQEAAFLFAALDCSTKSRAREIPITFSDGRPGPPPLRSTHYPEGLPNLSGRRKERVETDNAACHWVWTKSKPWPSAEGARSARTQAIRSVGSYPRSAR